MCAYKLQHHSSICCGLHTYVRHESLIYESWTSSEDRMRLWTWWLIPKHSDYWQNPTIFVFLRLRTCCYDQITDWHPRVSSIADWHPNRSKHSVRLLTKIQQFLFFCDGIYWPLQSRGFPRLTRYLTCDGCSKSQSENTGTHDPGVEALMWLCSVEEWGKAGLIEEGKKKGLTTPVLAIWIGVDTER